MPRHPDSRLNSSALLSVLVGIFSPFCFFWGIGGVGAVVLGSMAHGEIKRSEGRQHGLGLAIAGITLGVLHLLGLVVGVAVLVTLGSSGPFSARMSPPSPPLVVPTPVPAPAATPSPAPGPPNGTSTRETATLVTRFGGVTLVDPGPDAGRLGALLTREMAHAKADNQKLVVWISKPDCRSCTGVSIALFNPKLQAALVGVRLLRIDARDYRLELSERGLAPDALPGFALLGAHAEPIDYVNGGEWDADIAENIAPVLKKFIQGTYKRRRNAWSGVAHGGSALL